MTEVRSRHHGSPLVREVHGKPATSRPLRPGLLAVVGLVLLATAACAAEDPEAAARSDLEQRLRSAPRIDRFQFDHAAGGTRVNDCFLPNQRFRGIVDTKADSLVITDDGKSVVVLRAGTAFAHRSLFSGSVVPTEWLRIAPEAPAEVREAVTRALGPELGGYAVGGGLPPSGNDTALAVLAVASTVKRLPKEARSGTVERFVLTVPSEELARAPGSAEVDDPPPGDAVVELSVTAVGSVSRVAVRLAAGEGEEQDPGWILEYRPLAATGVTPDVSDATPTASIDLSALAPAQTDPVCEVPL